jgi:hypothetical protein
MELEWASSLGWRWVEVEGVAKQQNTLGFWVIFQVFKHNHHQFRLAGL